MQKAKPGNELAELPEFAIFDEGIPMPRQSFTLKETAQILGMSYLTVYRLVRRRKLKPVQGLRHKFISRDQIISFAASN
jgi:hypothetical protein